jgi:hypothetical protein
LPPVNLGVRPFAFDNESFNNFFRVQAMTITPNSLKFVRTIFFVSLCATAVAQTIEIPEGKPGQANGVAENVTELLSTVTASKETQKVSAAAEKERQKIPTGQVKTYEVISKGGSILNGGEFIRIQEVSQGPQLHEPDIYRSAPFKLGGNIPVPGNELTSTQRDELQARAEKAKQEAKAASDKAAADKAAADKAAAEKKAAADRARGDDAAEKNGREIMREINRDRERYKREGGPYRMPGG